MAATEAQLVSAFKNNQFSFQHAALLKQCADLTAQYGISATELSDAYDLFALQNNAGSDVTSDNITAFQQHLKQNPPKPATLTPARPLHKASAYVSPPSTGPRLQTVLADHSNLTRTPGISTPTPGKKGGAPEDGAAAKRARLSSAFKDRAARGAVQATLNEHVRFDGDAVPMEDSSLTEGSGRCAFQLLGPQLLPAQRYMVDRLEDKVAYLDGRITSFAAALEAQGLAPAQPVSATTQAEALFVGRVCCDGEGRLNEASAQLEGDIGTSKGARVRLDLSRVPALRLFTGQVIGVTGVNPSGSCLLASQLHVGTPLPLPATPPDQSARLARRTGGRPTSLVVAAGPFTTRSELSFEPLEELLAAVVQQGTPPTALLLAGPFLDAAHPVVAAGQLETPLQHVYEQEILQRIGEFAAAHPSTRVLLAPSPSDVIAAPVFPTPPLPRPGSSSKGQPPELQGSIAPLPDNVHMLPNPATFSLGEVVVGLVMADVLKAIAGNEVRRQQPGGMAGLAAHLLTQRSYFPVFPPPPGALLDTSLAADALRLPASPDVLLLPSELSLFAQLLPAAGDSKVVCINPGRLVKGDSGGTWARLQLRVADDVGSILSGKDAETNAPMPHRVDQRCRAEIIKI